MQRMAGKIGFMEDIVALVEGADRDCMLSMPRGGFDLHEWREVEPKANLILRHLRGENGLMLMPPGGWPPAKIETFEAWVTEGAPKRRGDIYAAYFRAIDGQTEYFDVYGAPDGLDDLTPSYRRFFGRDKLIQKQWLAYAQVVPSTPILQRKKDQLWQSVVDEATRPETKDGLLAIDEFVLNMVSDHFGSDELDLDALLGAYQAFGQDTLPIDEDRVSRVQALGNPNDYRLVNDFARFHRMDTRSLWFFWFGHLACTKAALAGGQDSRHDLRAALLAAIFVGQTVDTSLRTGSNGLTRPAYKGPGGLMNVLATAEVLAADWDSGITEMEELFWIWTGAVESV